MVHSDKSLSETIHPDDINLMNTVRWGVLGAAKIAREKVIPAMQQAPSCDVIGIASRSLATARSAADVLGIDRAYGSYEELLDDADIDAVYIPLPNHLHVPWSIRALEAGKHVLCEKPIGMGAGEARKLAEAAAHRPRLKVMEAFMYRHHPQWQTTKELVDSGAIGELRAIQSTFAYYNDDPANVRNQADIGGGALMDIGCYCISLARFLVGYDPERVAGSLKHHPTFGTDVLTSGVLDFGSGGTSTFVCATQMAPHQHVDVFGTTGKIAIDIPFNAPPDRPTTIHHTAGDETRTITFDVADQYTIQGELFSRAVLEGGPVPTSLGDAVANMEVIDALRRSDRSGKWMEL